MESKLFRLEETLDEMNKTIDNVNRLIEEQRLLKSIVEHSSESKRFENFTEGLNKDIERYEDNVKKLEPRINNLKEVIDLAKNDSKIENALNLLISAFNIYND